LKKNKIALIEKYRLMEIEKEKRKRKTKGKRVSAC